MMLPASSQGNWDDGYGRQHRGNYAYTLNTLNANANYVVALNSDAGSFRVTPAPLTITADDKTKAFGADNPTLTATISGLVNKRHIECGDRSRCSRRPRPS